VLERALREFWQHGYEATTMADLVAAMGIRSASIYACFESKEGLFREAVALYGRTVAEPPLRLLAEGTDLRASVHAMLRAYADAIANPAHPSGCLLTLGGVAGSDDSQGARDLLGSTRLQIRRSLHQRIEQSGASRRLLDDVNAAAVAGYLTSIIFGMSIQARDGATRTELDDVISCAMVSWDALFAGRPMT
jgi:AcrR family transcriptional regulator